MLLVKKLFDRAILPTIAHPGEDVAYDLYAADEVRIPGHGCAEVHTGIAMQFTPPRGALLRDRSSIAKARIIISGGVIDSGYRGEIVVLFENLGDYDFVFMPGSKIAQLIPIPVAEDYICEAYELGNSKRGANGFGSTGK